MNLVLASELVSNARKLVLFGHSKEAWNLLKAMIPQLQALKVLQGHQTVTGDSDQGFKVIDDESDQYFTELLNSYAGKYYTHTNFYEPYGVAPEVEEGDIPSWIFDRAGGMDKTRIMESWILSLWGENLTDDLVFHIQGKDFYNFGGDGESGWVLFRKTNPIPFWVKKTFNPRPAIEDWVEAFGPLPQLNKKSNIQYLSTKKDDEETNPGVKPYTPKPYTPTPYKPYVPYTPPPIKTYTKEELEAFGERVRQASKNFITIEADGQTYLIPQEPFEQWVLKANPSSALPWDPICPKGIKYTGDCPFRSDWVLGAGLDFEMLYKYNSTFMKEIGHLSDKLKEEKLSFPAEIYSSGNRDVYSSKVIHIKDGSEKGWGVGLVEEAGSEHLLLAQRCSAIIAEKPGKLIKLTEVPDSGFTVVVLENARQKLANGCYVKINMKKQRVEITEAPYSYSYTPPAYSAPSYPPYQLPKYEDDRWSIWD